LVGALAAVLSPVLAAEGANGHANYRAVCPGPPAGSARCHELVVTDAHGNPLASTSPTGLGPATIKSVYGFSTSATAGAGKTIAIVDAYDDPSAESDLAVFSSQFGLPACTSANGCFTKVNQTGGTRYPRANAGWALEISLDVQWAHAIAPGAKILLVEASSNSFTNLLAAEDYAKAHAQYVSNSWGASEFSGESLYDSHFSRSGVSFFVSSGDAGLPAEYPSASPGVISVGGTTLHFSGSTFTSETGWSEGGGGCSRYETATSAQSGFSQYGQVSCGGKRATPDVSLDADPSSGVAVYDSVPYNGRTGWFTVGGTSASAPMWAARSAAAGTVVDAAYVYGNNISFRDITSGDNGAPCLGGYDLCTGRGSWTGSSSGGGSSATKPDAPTGLAATAGNATVHLTWAAPANDGGATITSYEIHRATSTGTETTYASGVTETSYDDTSVVNGTTYYYEVAAVNSEGVGALSNEASATPSASIAQPPPEPTNLIADAAKGRGIQLSWDPSSDPTVSSYNIYRSPTGAGAFSQIASTASTSYKDTSTDRGTTYYYYVKAVNPAGESPASETKDATAK
jgi:subtilase family serine protease